MTAEGTAKAEAAGPEGILRRLADPRFDVGDLTQRDIELIATSLVPTSPKHDPSISYLTLSKICDTIRQSAASDVEATRRLTDLLSPYAQSIFSTADQEDTEGEVDVSRYLPFTCLLASLFPLGPQAGASLLTEPVGTNATDGEAQVDALAILLEAAELSSPLQPALASLLAQAAGTKAGRTLVQSRAVGWLRGGLDYDSGNQKELGALCAVALSKLGGAEVSTEDGEAPSGLEEGEVDHGTLVSKLIDHVLSRPPASSLLSALEGLSVLSLRPQIKHLLAHHPTFLSTLISYSPIPAARGGSLPITPRASMDLDDDKLLEMADTPLCYGITSILINITARRVVLSAEDEQLAKIRAMAISGKKSQAAEPVEPDPLEDDEHVRDGVGCVVRAGAVPAMRGLVRADSLLVKSSVGRLALQLVEDKENRPAFVREGGFRSLAIVVRDLLAPTKSRSESTHISSPSTTTSSSSSSSPNASPADSLPSFQALAKLVITMPPNLLFPPPYQTTALNSLIPLYTLLCHPLSSLLQQFESLMALTNVATIDPSIADRIVTAIIDAPSSTTHFVGSGRETPVRIISKVEELLVSDNLLVRRAASELVCNLAASGKGMEYLGSTNDARTRSKLNILLVLTAVDDVATRLAAAGALAMVTSSPAACEALLQGATEIETIRGQKRSTWGRLLGLLEPDAEVDEDEDENGEQIQDVSSAPPVLNVDLAHRAVVILLGLVEYVVSLGEAERKKALKAARAEGIEDKLMGLVRASVGEDVLAPTVEVLKTLKRYPS